MSARRLVVAALVLALACLRCTAVHVAQVTTSEPIPNPTPDVLAGVALADITPTPGLALFGHGPEARVSSGFRTRLRCPVFVLVSDAEAVALVPCDLAEMSIELQRDVAAAARRQGVPLGSGRIFVFATHTHAGPAHYFGPQRYSSSFSSYEPGFDPNVLAFLANRIGGAVAEAYASRKPACVGWARDDVYGLSRNRSLVQFESDQPRPPELVQAIARAKAANRGPSSPGEAAVDPSLFVMRIDARAAGATDCEHPGPTLGVFSVFGVHNTALPNTNDLYHGDIFGFATRALENCLRVPPQPNAGCRDVSARPEDAAPLAGIANGLEGDVSPTIDFHGAAEAQRLGRALADRIFAVHQKLGAPGALSSKFPIRVAYRDVVLPNAVADPVTRARLCPTPHIGTASAGGADDGPTRFRIFPEFNQGMKVASPGSSCHGPKLPLVGPDGAPKDDGIQFPNVVPVTLTLLGDAYLATLPAEATTVTGLRAREAIRTGLGISQDATTYLPIVNLANSYLEYVATAEEYAYQRYEGGATLYGPNESAFFVSQLGCLAHWQTKTQDDCELGQPNRVNAPVDVRSKPSPVVSRLEPIPTSDDAAVWLRDGVVEADREDGRPACRFEWRGIPSAALMLRSMLAVEVIDGTGAIVDDDRGSNIEVRYDDGTWRVRWIPPYDDNERPYWDESFRIRIRSRARIESRAFKLADCVGAAK